MSTLALKENRFYDWWPVVLGLLVLYVPTFYGLANGLWQDPDQAQGPLILMVVAYLFWQQREYLIVNSQAKTWTITGGIIFASGLLIYIIGRSQEILIFEVGSQILVVIGLLLITRGMKTLRAMWFPIFFLFFMLPLPGSFIDTMTLPMKIAVSYVADNVLFWFGYPIARTGVMLQVGQYQLMVADACAGMHTLVSLEALGLLYLNLIKHDSAVRNIVLATLIIPISFIANVTRVMILILITYYFGDEAGQGFVHKFAGMVLFIVALMMIMGIDSALQHYVKRRSVNCDHA